MKTTSLLIYTFICLIPLKAQNRLLNISINPIEIGCLHYQGESIIINNQQEYDALYNPFTDIPECENYILPEIDFDEFVLVGINTSYGGDLINISEDLIKDNVSYTVQFVIKIYKKGFARKLNIIYFWRLIQKEAIENYNFKVKILQYQQ